jgi:tetratricopeptide (TPR) repeat protein
VRITAQLVHGRTDRHLWAEVYQRNLGNVLELQGEVAQAIASQVRVKLTPQEHDRLAIARPVNFEAYDLYLRGLYHGNRISNAGLNKSLEYFQKAIHLDPSFAPAYSGIADTYLTLGIDGFVSGTVAFPKANAAALRALEIDGSSAEAHASMGFVLFNYEHEHGAAIKELETAIRLNPNYVKARLWYALSLAWLGRNGVAIRELEQARRLDPLSARINANFVYLYYLGRQYDRAIAEGREALKAEPNDSWTLGFLGRAYLQNDMPMDAFAAFQRRLTLEPNFPKVEADMAVAHCAIGNRKEALKILEKLQRQSNHQYVTPYPMARAYLELGQKKEALAWLQKGLEVDDGDMMQLYVDPALDPLRFDQRFQDLLRRMNFPK